MAKRKVYEGTWEELATHADELRGCSKLTLIVSDEADARNDTADTSINLAEALKDYVGAAHFGDANLSEDTGKKFASILAAKHQKEHK